MYAELLLTGNIKRKLIYCRDKKAIHERIVKCADTAVLVIFIIFVFASATITTIYPKKYSLYL